MRRAEPLPLPEFVVLLAFMVSIVAMSTDVILPALGPVAEEFALADQNDAQLMVSSLFLGFAAGQLMAGPLSDRYGRKPVICAGYAVFAAGCLIALFAASFAVLILGRILQGLGAAAPRVVSLALVRDGYEGAAMARIMSIVMAVFILVPALAPALGQGIIALAGWRACFAVMLAMAAAAALWLALRQPETLAPEARRGLSAAAIAGGIAEALGHRVALGYMLATGLIFGAFLGYLSSAQQIFQVAYGTGPRFALWFAVAALSVGAASVVNARLVMRLGTRALTRAALVGTAGAAALFLVPVLALDGLPPFAAFMAWLLATFFCFGVLFGNLAALAMAPLGHMAGLGAALVGAVPTLMSLPFGWAVGAAFRGGVTPLVAGFMVASLAALAVLRWADPAGALVAREPPG